MILFLTPCDERVVGLRIVEAHASCLPSSNELLSHERPTSQSHDIPLSAVQSLQNILVVPAVTFLQYTLKWLLEYLGTWSLPGQSEVQKLQRYSGCLQSELQ